MVERILVLGFQVPDVGSFRLVHGDSHRGMDKLFKSNCRRVLMCRQACWGPLSFLMIYFIAVSHPMRHPLQIIISLGQIYGDVLYYATSMFDHYHKGLTYCRPEAFYFWGYYFMMNFFWIVIPGRKCPPLPTELHHTDWEQCLSKAAWAQ